MFLTIFIIILIAIFIYNVNMNVFNNSVEDQLNTREQILFPKPLPMPIPLPIPIPIPMNYNNSQKPSIYVFVSDTCPACISYKNGNKSHVEKAVNEMGLELIEVNVNSKLDNNTRDIYKKCNVEYIPYACSVKPNGEIKRLGNGNNLNKDIIISAL